MIWVNYMGANSIRANLSREDIISTIRLSRAADFNHTSTYVIVEGMDDTSFFRKNLSEAVDVYESYSGKIGVLDIVSHFDVDNVIGICDRDYETSAPPNHIFYYDYCCLEAMLLSSRDKFIEVCGVLYTNVSNQQLSQIYDNMFSEIRWLSALRKINFQYQLGLRINCVSLSKAFDPATKKIQKEVLVNQIKNMNAPIFQAHPTLIQTTDSEEKCIQSLEDDLNNLNGHDIIQLIHCYLRAPTGADPYNARVIRISLIHGYDFSRSNLYQMLLQYEIDTQIKVVS